MSKPLKNELLYVRTPIESLPSIHELEQRYENIEDRAACVIRHLIRSAQNVNKKNELEAEKTGEHKANPDDYFSTKNIGPDIKRIRIPRAMKLHNLVQKNPTAFVGFEIKGINSEVDHV